VIDSLPATSTDEQIRIVLLVEDEAMVRMDLAHQLRTAGFTVIEAVDGQEAVHVLESTLRVDMVITDLRMPRMDGAALVRKIRSHYPHLPVFMTAGQPPSQDVYELLDGFFLKPFDVAKVVSHLKTLLPAAQRPAS
jgi:CheY-like chemotaxis protein